MNMTSHKVWYKLNNEDVALLEVSGTDVASLKFEIFKKGIRVHLDDIHVFAPSDFDFDFDSAGLPDDAAIPNGSSQSDPIVVKVQQESMQMQGKRAKLNHVFFEQLKPPIEVEPPRTNTPVFVAQDGWLEEAMTEIQAHMEDSDDPTDMDNYTFKRVPPMAVVRCSRGGKTRALYEIANATHADNSRIGPKAAALYISFNDFSYLQDWEQEDPLQALLRRIVFMGSHGVKNSESFGAFIQDRPIVQVQDFLKWLGDTPCILLIDELNNLDELTKSRSAKASEFGGFLKQHFIGAKNRYLVFSSHVLSTLQVFADFVDPSNGSSRGVVLLDLPLVDSLLKARDLNHSLDSAREAIYYGLMPGMIYEAAEGRIVGGKRSKCKDKFLANSSDLERDFKSILASLITGESSSIPADLHMLLDSARGDRNSYGKIRWVPFHLSFILQSLANSFSYPFNKIAQTLAELCEGIKNSKNESGQGWEAIFVLFLLARCLARRPDDVFVPESWFEKVPMVSYNNYSSVNAQNVRLFSKCKTWDEIKEGLNIGQEPQISIFYPTHSSFAVYDAVVVYSDNGQIVCTNRYQLKQGKSSDKHRAHSSFSKSFFVQGKPPKETKLDGGWCIPSKDVIDAFYGESGKYWTPERWRQFEGTAKEG